MPMEKWKSLEVWKLSNELATKVYIITKDFPKEEIYGLTSQLRWAALSVPTNIVEGHSRSGDKELARFLDIALGSLGETKYLLFFSKELGYITEKHFFTLDNLAQDVGAKLWSFYKVVKGTAPAVSHMQKTTHASIDVLISPWAYSLKHLANFILLMAYGVRPMAKINDSPWK